MTEQDFYQQGVYWLSFRIEMIETDPPWRMTKDGYLLLEIPAFRPSQ